MYFFGEVFETLHYCNHWLISDALDLDHVPTLRLVVPGSDRIPIEELGLHKCNSLVTLTRKPLETYSDTYHTCNSKNPSDDELDNLVDGDNNEIDDPENAEMNTNFGIPERFTKGFCSPGKEGCCRQQGGSLSESSSFDHGDTCTRRHKDRSKTDAMLQRMDAVAFGDNRKGIIRRDSYKQAVESAEQSCNEKISVKIPRSRSHSFKAALDGGQVSPSSISSGTTSTSTTDSTSDETVDTESGSLNFAPKPRYSSTPLPTTVNRHVGTAGQNYDVGGDEIDKIERVLFKDDGLPYDK